MSVLSALRYYKYFHKHLFFYRRAFVEYSLGLFTSKRRLMAAEIFVNTHCNFNCWHCSSSIYESDKNKPRSLSIEQIELMLNRLRSMGVINVAYVGGEPTLRKDLCDIIEMTNSHKILPSLITNASLLTPEKVDQLFDSGLANMGFSMQSMNSAVHDGLVRYDGALSNTLGMIDYCLKKKYPISVCVVPTNENLANGDFESLVSYANERKLRINANLPAPIGKLFKVPDFLLNKKSLDVLVSKYFPLSNFLPDFKQTTLTCKIRCPMGEKIIYIFPNGEVCPCTFTHISFGNILDEDIDVIIRRMDESPVLKMLKRDDQCPISMDSDFIQRVNEAVTCSACYPPRASDVGF